MHVWLGADLTAIARQVTSHAATTSALVLAVATVDNQNAVAARLTYHARGHRCTRLAGLTTFGSGGRIRLIVDTDHDWTRLHGGHIDGLWLTHNRLTLDHLETLTTRAAWLARPAPATVRP